MKRKFNYFFAVLLSVSLFSCGEDSKGIPGEGPDKNKKTFEDVKFVDLAKLVDSKVADLSKNFETLESVESSKDKFVAYVKDESGFKYQANILGDAKAEKVEKIILKPYSGENKETDSEIFAKILNDATKLHLGTFLGTKFKNTSTNAGGVHQSLDETIALVKNANNFKFCTLFGTARSARTAVYLNNSVLDIVFCRNYLPLDFKTIGKFVNRELSDVLNEYYEIANQISFGTALSYLTFSTGIDVQGNHYEVNMDSDKSLKKIKEVSCYIPEDNNTIARWKDILQNASKLELGTDPVYYVNDAFGEKIKDLASIQEAIDLYEAEGRKYGILAKYKSEVGYNTLILNKDYCYIMTTVK